MKNYKKILDKIGNLINDLIGVALILIGAIVAFSISNKTDMLDPVSVISLLLLSILVVSSGYIIIIISKDND